MGVLADGMLRNSSRRMTFATVALLLQFLASPALSRDQDRGYHGQGHDALHHWYLTLRDWRGRPCCNGQDCRPSQSRVRNERIEVMVDGEWTEVPDYKILPNTSPDLRTHVCSPKRPHNYPRGHVFCVVLGAGV